MQEAYTCVCGSQHWTINDNNTITCPHCGRVVTLVFRNDRLESAEEFYIRVRAEG